MRGKSEVVENNKTVVLDSHWWQDYIVFSGSMFIVLYFLFCLMLPFGSRV